MDVHTAPYFSIFYLQMEGVLKMLYTIESICNSDLEQWKKDAVHVFSSKLGDKNHLFPCIPAAQGLQLGHFRFGFVSDPAKTKSALELAHALEEYSKNYHGFGKYTSLVIFYETTKALMETERIEKFEGLFWDQLNFLSELDPKTWPHHIPTDPHHPLWEFCFCGESYFMYCATPAHSYRKSRHFPYFMLAITPRSVLNDFHSNPSHASKIKSAIRQRLEIYDSIEIHPDLNTYGNDHNFECKQYFLHDDGTSRQTCPFHKKQHEK